MKNKEIAYLILEDGKYYKGILENKFSKKECIGEIIFNTSMTGYQEIITDPSYKKQIVIFTYPSIGNYGFNSEDNESDKAYLEAVIIKDYCEMPSNYRSEGKLSDFLDRQEVPLVSNIDTRALVRHIREKGSMRAGVFQFTENDNIENNVAQAVSKLSNHPKMEGQNLTNEFNGKSANNFVRSYVQKYKLEAANFKKICALDFGVKFSIIEHLLQNKIYPIFYPGSTPFEKWENFNENEFEGYFFSNGPGDPASVEEGIQNIKYILTLKKPIFGICLGHQMLSLALGANTYKLKFGHHGGNQPVKKESLSEVQITAQNHGFSVDADSLLKAFKDKPQVFEKEINPNDNTIEGFYIENSENRLLSVQYHPEAGPGPHDASKLFSYFSKMMQPD
ncbi:MAG: glutamine-hydrolyzing carbamoyl-phosphate synthase small subunit [Spirochaetia bacterium]|nr:glutamine-hydrolyzing carbamoyl-phosphate synthase small subunit [Spirochaetia bacterium]